MKLFRYFSIVPLVVAGLFVGAPPAQAAKEEEGGFHLVYLVAAVDLKPGSKVTVDPVFFTDGKEVKNFHDFCRNQNPLKPEQVAADRKFIEDYCARKTFIFDSKSYHTLNNHGQQIGLDAVEFKVIDRIVQTQEPVMLGHGTVASYVPGTINPPKWLRNDSAPEYFFLMARDKAILEKIAPVSKASQAEVDSLVKRAEEFAKVARGKRSGVPLHAKDVAQALDCRRDSTVTLFRLENPLFADLDLDGKLDMRVSAYNIVRMETEPDKPLIDCFTHYEILGSGDTVLMGNEQWVRTPWASMKHPGGTYDHYIKNGYAPQASLMAVNFPGKNRMCAYKVDNFSQSIVHHADGVVLWSGDRTCPPLGGMQKFRNLLGSGH